MDRGAFDDRRKIGTVKATINMYGERILEGSSTLKETQIDLSEKSSSRARELHQANREMIKYKESRKVADLVKDQAESKLSNAKKTVKNLTLQVEESNSKKVKKSSKRKEKVFDAKIDENLKYAEMARELEYVKQELSKLKLDMASVMEEKTKAEKEIEGSSSKLLSNWSSAEAIRKEIEEVNEEEMVVELARIEALKEFGEIEVQREKEASESLFGMEESRKKMKDVTEEIDRSKEVESKLAVTLADVNVLKNELKLVKEIEKKVLRNDSLKHSGGSFRINDRFNDIPSLNSIEKELEEAKKELAATREEGFQFMASMDIIRSELKHVTEEAIRLKKTEQKADLTVQNLNSKLLRAKTKLEAASANEEKAKSIVSNLSLTLEKMKTESEMAKKEKEILSAETANIMAEIQKTEAEIDITEGKLQAAMEELEVVKASEALALENLENLIENAMSIRASTSKQSPSITISKFEHEYLTGLAVKAEEIADKKVAAAQAWIEALKAHEKEILMKIEQAHRDIRENKVKEDKEMYRTERSGSSKRAVEGEISNWPALQRKSMRSNGRNSMKDDGNRTPLKHGKGRKSGSPAVKTTAGSNSFIIRKKKKVMPNLAKFFSGKKIGKDL